MKHGMIGAPHLFEMLEGKAGDSPLSLGDLVAEDGGVLSRSPLEAAYSRLRSTPVAVTTNSPWRSKVSPSDRWTRMDTVLSG